MQRSFWKWFWRAVGLLAALFMIANLLSLWASWRATSFRAAANGKAVESGMDVVSIQLDILSLVIAVVAIGLGVAGFVGYQAIREGAVKRAQETAEREIALVAPPLIRRELSEYMRTFRGETPISDVDVDAMVAAAGEDGKEAGDER